MSLLQVFFVPSVGGDDVQQLCDAGEEEFLEIMALVGMASKPLHVRRFQKALQEWLANPRKFIFFCYKIKPSSGKMFLKKFFTKMLSKKSGGLNCL